MGKSDEFVLATKEVVKASNGKITKKQYQEMLKSFAEAGIENAFESGSKAVNIDTGTANAFISQDSSIRNELEAFVQGKDMVMTETAVNEFRNIVNGAGGVLEQSRAEEFLNRVTIIPDNPSARAMELQVTKKVGANDKIIFGTGDNLDIVTMTSDAKFVRGASAQGVDFKVYVHHPVPLQGR